MGEWKLKSESDTDKTYVELDDEGNEIDSYTEFLVPGLELRTPQRDGLPVAMRSRVKQYVPAAIGGGIGAAVVVAVQRLLS